MADHRSRLVRRLEVLAGALIISCGNATFAADSYVEDANGCKAFDSHPVPNESVTWSGACKDGFLDGPGKLSWTVDGKPAGSSEGSYLKGKLEGQGVRNYKDGARYEGEFAANDPDGQGKMTRADGSVASGRWEKNKLVDADATKFDRGVTLGAKQIRGRSCQRFGLIGSPPKGNESGAKESAAGGIACPEASDGARRSLDRAQQ